MPVYFYRVLERRSYAEKGQPLLVVPCSVFEVIEGRNRGCEAENGIKSGFKFAHIYHTTSIRVQGTTNVTRFSFVVLNEGGVVVGVAL